MSHTFFPMGNPSTGKSGKSHDLEFPLTYSVLFQLHLYRYRISGFLGTSKSIFLFRSNLACTSFNKVALGIRKLYCLVATPAIIALFGKLGQMPNTQLPIPSAQSNQLYARIPVQWLNKLLHLLEITLITSA